MVEAGFVLLMPISRTDPGARADSISALLIRSRTVASRSAMLECESVIAAAGSLISVGFTVKLTQVLYRSQTDALDDAT